MKILNMVLALLVVIMFSVMIDRSYAALIMTYNDGNIKSINIHWEDITTGEGEEAVTTTELVLDIYYILSDDNHTSTISKKNKHILASGPKDHLVGDLAPYVQDDLGVSGYNVTIPAWAQP